MNYKQLSKIADARLDSHEDIKNEFTKLGFKVEDVSGDKIVTVTVDGDISEVVPDLDDIDDWVGTQVNLWGTPYYQGNNEFEIDYSN